MVVAALTLIAGPSVRAAGLSELIDRVMAVVAGNLITLSDVNAAKDFALLGEAATSASARDALPLLIDRALMLAEVDRYAPPEPAAAAVDRRLEAVRARFVTRQAFEAALARVGYDERHLREVFRQDLRLVAYLDQRFTVPPSTEDELGRYYRDHVDLFTDNGRLTPFDLARQRVVDAMTADRRRQLVDDWVAGLRRRAEIVGVFDGPVP